MELFSVGVRVRDRYYVVILGEGEMRDIEQKQMESSVVKYLNNMTNYQTVPYDSQLMPQIEFLYKLPYQPAEIVNQVRS